MVELSQRGMVAGVTEVFSAMTDPRKGKNIRYSFINTYLVAFGSFFLQSPSFLAYQRLMEEKIGSNRRDSSFFFTGIAL